MEPHDEPSLEPSIADSEAPSSSPQDNEAASTIAEDLSIDADLGAALLLSGNYSRSLADRVFSGLSQEEIARLSLGLLRVKALPDERLERIWNRLTGLFTGDWRDEEDLVEFIRGVLRKGVREEPLLSGVQKLALLLLSLGEETGRPVCDAMLNTLDRQGAIELTREIAHLLHHPNTAVVQRVAGEFLAYCASRALPKVFFMSSRVMELEAERLVRRDPAYAAAVVEQLWLGEASPLTTFQQAARMQPRQTVGMLKHFAQASGAPQFVPFAERAAAFRACLSTEAASMLDDALPLENGLLPEPFVSTARREMALRDFLHHFYLGSMLDIPVVMN